jgi:signal transduction histidine kinase
MSHSTLHPIESTLARLLNTRLRSALAPTDLTPAQITLIYAILGFGALYLSDVFLPQAITDPAALAQVQALKGGAEVVLTAGLIFLLTVRGRQAIEQRNDQLESLHAERDVLHRVFRHNLRHDVNIIMGYSDLIRQGTTDEELLEHCETVLNRLSRIERYQDKIIKFEHILEPRRTLQRMDLTEMARSNAVVQELQASADVSFSMDLPDESPVIASPSIRTAFQEIVENAVEHNTSEDPSVRVRIEENSDELVDLVVEDNGPGIPDYERLAVEGMQEEDLTHSSGLGLWLATLACTFPCRLLASAAPVARRRVYRQIPEAPERTIQRRIPAISG